MKQSSMKITWIVSAIVLALVAILILPRVYLYVTATPRQQQAQRVAYKCQWARTVKTDAARKRCADAFRHFMFSDRGY